MAHAGAVLAQAGPASSRVIAPLEQTARDHDRIEVLRQELKKSEEQLESLVRRKAERLAASDMQAATEAEDQRARTLGDIASLKREIASTSHVAGQTTVVKPFAARPAQSHPVSGKGMAPAPWWDVYGSGRHIGLPVSPSQSPAPVPGVRGAPARPNGVAP